MNIIVLGPPGSGKGTQARIVAGIYGLLVVDTGRLLRNSEDLSANIMNSIKRGHLVSDDVVVSVIEKHLKLIGKGFILDGFPRTLVQAKDLWGFGCGIDLVIEMHLTEDIIISRLSTRFLCTDCGSIFSVSLDSCNNCFSPRISKRDDDISGINVIKHRISQYMEQRKIISDFLIAKGVRRCIIDATSCIEDVTENIKKNLLCLL